MNINVIINKQRLRFQGKEILNQPVIGNEDTIVTYLEGAELSALVAQHPTGSVLIFSDDKDSDDKDGSATLQSTLKALSGFEDRINVRVPSEKHLDWAGDFPHSRVHGSLTRPHFDLEIGEYLAKAGVPNGEGFLNNALASTR